MKREEAFALHMRSRFMDMANNCSGILRCWANDIDKGRLTLTEIREFLLRQADDLQKKLNLAKEEITMFLGSEDKLKALLLEDLAADWKLSSPSAGIWKEE